MDQCDTKIGIINICRSMAYISWWKDFAIYCDCQCHRFEIMLMHKVMAVAGIYLYHSSGHLLLLGVSFMQKIDKQY